MFPIVCNATDMIHFWTYFLFDKLINNINIVQKLSMDSWRYMVKNSIFFSSITKRSNSFKWVVVLTSLLYIILQCVSFNNGVQKNLNCDYHNNGGVSATIFRFSFMILELGRYHMICIPRSSQLSVVNIHQKYISY